VNNRFLKLEKIFAFGNDIIFTRQCLHGDSAIP